MHEKHLYGRGPGGFHRIAYTEWGQASAQPPVICVHGLVRNGRDFDYLARAEGTGFFISAEGWAVTNPLLP